MLLLLVLALFPFQIFGLTVSTTKWDLANLVFVAFVISIAFASRETPSSRRFQLLLVAYLVVEAILFFNGPTTPSRFASAFLWITSILVLYGRRDVVPLPAASAYRVIVAGIAVLVGTLLVQFLYLKEGRPGGTFAEPSPAGLVILAAAAGADHLVAVGEPSQ